VATTVSDLYATLGVEQTATVDEISVAFREHAREMHPDLHPGDAELAERFKELTHAYNVLAHPRSRAAYDERRAAPSTAPLPSSGHMPVLGTPGRARLAVWGGITLMLLGVAGAVALAGIDTGDTAKTITLWLVVVKLVACGALLGGIGAWRLRRLRHV
jgi:hypothetical protein